VIIEGWVAFREDATWKKIVDNPKKSNFWYIVLLDDKPLLHLFRSRRLRMRNSNAEHDHLHKCKSLDLTGDIAVRVTLVLEEMGNEVCIFDQETGIHHCSLLAIPIPESAFLDGDRSHLAKEALMAIFRPYKKVATFVPLLSSNNNDRSAAADATRQPPVTRGCANISLCTLGTSQKLYMSTNTICEHNIPDILFIRSFNLNSTCSARGNVSYLFFFLRDKHTTFYSRLHVLFVSTI
jgi:hypothetical protein